MDWKVILGLILGLVVLVAIGISYGKLRWDALTKELHAQLEAARVPIAPKVFEEHELKGLPAPVQRYFRTVLQEGQPIVSLVQVEHVGTFNMSAEGEQWKPFVSSQRVVTRRPGFVWDARITMLPGVVAYVHDAYVAGRGILRANVLGLITLMHLPSTPELARGELMRFFAEAAWYPTALLPSQGVLWQAIDDRSAQATLKDGENVLTMTFRFNEDGLIESVRAEARGRIVGNMTIPTAWEGRWRDYAQRQGMLIPLEGEVAWLLPKGAKPYWRGRITTITYEFAR
ncbi:MAG: hypothetical protein DDG58_06390 [Ardenticatenia bacterium]|jgi:hypothetical protein|nr:MAG: hypothetical protein DDG58_06390 [Ardenticatenia bacterium]